MTKPASSPRVAALIGPYLSGKTALLNAMLVETGEIGRRSGGSKAGFQIGDASPEAKSRQMSTELNIATTSYLGETWTFLDCPGSVELGQDGHDALMVADVAVVVCEPGRDKALTVAPILRFMEDHAIPHILFINKMDHTDASARETLEALQDVSSVPLVMREIPIRDGNEITGHVDLVSERAFRWNEGAASALIELPDQVKDREEAARTELLESLADFDDTLLEQLLEDVVPSTDDVYANLTKDMGESLIVPVFFGSAEHGNGVRRLLKALRHETPEPAATAERLGEPSDATGAPVARVFKTVHAGHAGKQSFVRVWGGTLKDGMTLACGRVSGMVRPKGGQTEKASEAGFGEVVALGRLDEASTGDLVSVSGDQNGTDWPEPLAPLFSMAIHAADRQDEVKLSQALTKLTDEDPAVTVTQNGDTGELLMWGQGEVHLLIAIDRLKNKYNIAVTGERPQVPYKETIRKTAHKHARHKKQSGGHGEFGDVQLDIKPLPRGSGFQFGDTITGGVVPKQYIPAVEAGVKEYMSQGPLGFPVVDVSVTLTDGQYHSVDSSDMAFRKAAAQAMREGMPECQPVLLEPICMVTISLPNEFTSKVQRLVSGRRGQIMGFDAKAGWSGWDEVQVQLPQSEMHDLIIELRSLTLGVGTFDWRFDRLNELMGREADQVVAARAQAAE